MSDKQYEADRNAPNHAPPPTLGGGPSGGDDFSRQEAADYIASLLESLRPIAEQAKLSFLAYLITIALQEAKAEKTRAD